MLGVINRQGTSTSGHTDGGGERREGPGCTVVQKRIPRMVKSSNQRERPWKLPRGPADATRQKPKNKAMPAFLQEHWKSTADRDRGELLESL